MSCAWKLLTAAAVFHVTGKDSRRYLNNRLSNDLRSIQAGEFVAAAALTPQGRVEGLFTVYCDGADSFFLVADGGNRQAMFAALGRYIVADRVSLQDFSSSSVCVHVAGSASDQQRVLDVVGSKRILRSPSARIAPEGLDLLLLECSAEEALQALAPSCGEPLTDEAYDIARAQYGFAAYPVEINEDVILTESKRRDAVSFSKGCYVGQEVIERSDAIGKVPRQIERITLAGVAALTPGDAVVGSEGAAIGKVVTAYQDVAHNRTFLFALLRTGKYAAGDRVRCGELSGEIVLSGGNEQ